jgi:hypothetical protein
MFSILRTPHAANPASRRRVRRPRPARRPERLRLVLWVESLEDRTLLSGGPLGGGLAVPASPLDPAVPGQFAQPSPQSTFQNAAATTPAAQQALPESVFIGGFQAPTAAAAVTTATVPPPLLTAQVGTESLPIQEGLLAPWMLQQHNLPLLLGGGGGSNAMLGPDTRDNPRANPGPAAVQPSGEQEEPAPAGDKGSITPAPVIPLAQPTQPRTVLAPMTDGDGQPALVANPPAAEKLPGWEIVRETGVPAEVVQRVEQTPAVQPAAAPATPAPIWARVFSALSFAAGAVGAVWFPKFAVTGMSREDLLSLRRGTRRESLHS